MTSFPPLTGLQYPADGHLFEYMLVQQKRIRLKTKSISSLTVVQSAYSTFFQRGSDTLSVVRLSPSPKASSTFFQVETLLLFAL